MTPQDQIGVEVDRDESQLTSQNGAQSWNLQRGFQDVMDLASSYAKTATPAMRERDVAVKACAQTLSNNLTDVAASMKLERSSLQVHMGGRQSNYSPVPWIRIFSSEHSPRAMQGYYLVYLFSADGQRLYLSLNQGTSEFRSGAMRPIRDSGILFSRAVEARFELTKLTATPGGPDAKISIDLAWTRLETVGEESKRRIRNYEQANIVALEYMSGRLPDEKGLVGDLAKMLPLLDILYNGTTVLEGLTIPQRVEIDESQESTLKARGRVQGIQIDPLIRRAIELYAEDHAVNYFESEGFSVDRIGHLHRGFDLEARHPVHGEIHIEVKGTRTYGEEVVLTPNEVRHNLNMEDCSANHALYLVSQINISETGECFDGRAICIMPWRIEKASLTPTQYAYRIPLSESNLLTEIDSKSSNG